MRQGLLDPEALVESGLSIRRIAGRNSNFIIELANGSGYLLKQAVDAEKASFLDNEARVYTYLSGYNDQFTRYIPPLQSYNEDEHILVLGLLPSARQLGEHLVRTGRFSTMIARQLGRMLAALHRRGSHDRANNPVTLATRPVPWVLSIHRPHIELYRLASQANLNLIAKIQMFPDLCDHIEALKQTWQPLALIHYDLKLENMLVVPATKAGQSRLTVRLVDWEMAGIGDPCWDIGSVFGAVLSFWLHSMPFSGDGAQGLSPEFARFPLQRARSALLNFWISYERGMQFAPSISNDCLLRSTSFAAARLVQSVFEQCQVMTQLPGTALNALQLSSNILHKPLEAAVHLLGLQPRVEWNEAQL